jgi:ATP-dependent DNA helicase RecG
MNDIYQKPIEYLKGVGPHRGEILRKELGIRCFGDMVQLFPNRFIDRTRYYKIAEIQALPTEIQVIGKVVQFKVIEQKKGKRLVAVFADESGQMELVWFQSQKWVKDNILLQTPYVIFGKTNQFGITHSMAHPEMELLSEHQERLRSSMQAVYPSTEKLIQKGLTQRVMGKLMQQIFIESGGVFMETIPKNLLDRLQLMGKREAMFNIHFPTHQNNLAKAQFRLKFEELLFIQLQLISKNLIRKHKIKGHIFKDVGQHFTNFYKNHLPFELTQAQKRVIKEIRNDLGNGAQMNRLLQGDVGSGKTIVAFMSMLLSIDNGFQACLMAPTEILATQHFHGISELAQKIGIQVALLTGSSKIAQRRMIHENLKSGSLHILIGTHALLEDVVQFQNLGMAIIDEQHRFGVEQRSKLWQKNTIPPHILVMTATPIPRTLAMSLYGDLDISVIDELPPGRKPISTVHRFDNNRLKVWKFIKDEIAKGRQIYVVYPLIDESEKLDYKDLMDGFEGISRDFPLPQYSVSMLHGKMKPVEKEAEMQRFAQGKTNIMVATTVIEVGVNVPNASVMIIESAERFGLSQLHQLRGRVGRGAEQSYCILMTGHKLSADSKVRMETMCRTNDGFEIAEVDLNLRGPGDILGTQQSGILNLQIADLVKDKDILQLARFEAIQILKSDPYLQDPMHENLKLTYQKLTQKKNIWNYIS